MRTVRCSGRLGGGGGVSAQGGLLKTLPGRNYVADGNNYDYNQNISTDITYVG